MRALIEKILASMGLMLVSRHDETCNKSLKLFNMTSLLKNKYYNDACHMYEMLAENNIDHLEGAYLFFDWKKITEEDSPF